MVEFTIPKIGQRVRVFTGYTIAWMNEYNRPIVGTVAPSNPWDHPNSFRLYPSDLGIGSASGDSTISTDRVTRIEYLDSSQDTQTIEKVPVEPSTGSVAPVYFQVEGSKGASYTVTKIGDKFTCNCVAAGFGRQCKHVTKIRDQLAD